MPRALLPSEVATMMKVNEFVWLCHQVDVREGRKNVLFNILQIDRGAENLAVQIDVGRGEVYWMRVMNCGVNVAVDGGGSTRAA